MRVWTKQAESGKTVELRFQDSTISICVAGEPKGSTGCVVELGDRKCNCCATFHRMVKPDGTFAIHCHHSF